MTEYYRGGTVTIILVYHMRVSQFSRHQPGRARFVFPRFAAEASQEESCFAAVHAAVDLSAAGVASAATTTRGD